jgi:UDP-N-acetylenolpyruvoylglucosamine reductase
MELQQNRSLKSLNTFAIEANTRYYAEFRSLDELRELIGIKNQHSFPLMVLGGGSNVLFTKDYDGLVLKNELKGIDIVKEDDRNIYIKVMAGENWHQFVMYCVNQNFAGVENLSLIPGNVGASPMQNIGAYGVEIKDVFHELEAYDKEDKVVRMFTENDCEFGYRESVFKNRLKDRFIILSVTYRLNWEPQYNTSYGAIQQELENMGVKELSCKAISQAVINIRSSKLPDPKQIGNAGSFFKNPTIPVSKYQSLIKEWPSMPSYPVNEELIKLPAGWLIEQCGWKGYREGDAGCYPKQALVLVNYGNATGQQILHLSEQIIASVQSKFNIKLEREVNVI